jgi:Mitochondrial carrier protein
MMSSFFSRTTTTIRMATVVFTITIMTALFSSFTYAASDFHPSSSSSSYYFHEIRALTDENKQTNNINKAKVSTNNCTDMETSPCNDNYDEVCIVSAQELMCQGGDENARGTRDTSSSSTSSSSFDLSLSSEAVFYQLDEYDVEDEDEDNSNNDDDDDDNDGHSSMLSTASLRRSRSSRVAVSTGGSTRSYDSSSPSYFDEATSTSSKNSDGGGPNQFYRMESDTRSSRHHNRRWKAPALSNRRQRQKKLSHSHAVLSSLRGGAAASSAGSDLAKKLINSAIVTLVFEACMGHIMEFLKIAMQTSPKGTTYAKVYKDITSEKGITGLWDGFMPWGVIQAVLKGGVFGLAYAMANKSLLPLADEGVIPLKLAQTLAGGIAGGFQGFVLSPTLLMKTRVMTNEVFRESMSLFETTWKSLVVGGDIIKTEGLGSLMKGANTFALKRVFDWSTRYYFADLFESVFASLKGSSLTFTEKMVASLLGGVASTILTLPLDVLVAKTQDAKKAGVKVSAWKLFSEELQQEGWSGLKGNYMRGFEARLAHVCLTTVVMKTVAPLVYDLLFK